TTHTPRSFPLATWVQLSRIRHGKPTAVLHSLPGIDSPPGLLLAQQDGRRISFLTGDGPRVREAWHMLLPDETPAGSVVGFPAVREKGEPTRLVHAGADANVRVIASGRRTVEIPFTAGPVASPLAVRLRASELPSILFVDGRPRLNCLRAGSPQ